MCGLFGSTSLERHKVLYKLNQDRGDFAYGGIYIGADYMIVQRDPGVANIYSDKVFKYYLGHTQAPTSSKRTFDEATSHPFKCGDWYVAHNGVLSNDRILIEGAWKGATPPEVNEVDSSVIPALLDKLQHEGRNEIDAIVEVLELLRGTFGVWICNKLSQKCYLARVGSTLFADSHGCSFSSKIDPYKMMEPVEEGVLYSINARENVLKPITAFKYISPFFIL